ncbi:hypothetical protein D3C72_1793870 [compost metagenome]
MQALQPVDGLLFEFVGALADAGEAEGAGCARQLVQLIAQAAQLLQLRLLVAGLQQFGLVGQFRQFLRQALGELFAEQLQLALQFAGRGVRFSHEHCSISVEPGRPVALDRRV